MLLIVVSIIKDKGFDPMSFPIRSTPLFVLPASFSLQYGFQLIFYFLQLFIRIFSRSSINYLATFIKDIKIGFVFAIQFKELL